MESAVTYETADSEGDETVREELRALAVGDTGLGGVVDEEGAGVISVGLHAIRDGTEITHPIVTWAPQYKNNGEVSILFSGWLGVTYLSDETRDGAVLHVERLVGLGVVSGSLCQSVRHGLKGFLRNLGKTREEEGHGDEHAHARDGEVDPLDVGEVVGVGTGEEVFGRDEGAGERGDTVERLGELQSEVGDVDWGHGRDVRVCSDFERGETASDDGGADDETAKDALLVGGGDRELYDGPEENGAERVEAETHDDGELVSPALQHFTGDGGVGKVTDTEVGDLKTGGLELGDTEDILEVLVKDVEETVGETPQEEEGGDEDERPD
jgi:hypothetical protein